MTAENLIKELERYRTELTNIMKRFTRTRDSLSMNRDDDPRLRSFVIELVDLLNDSIGENQYSPLIDMTYSNGYSPFYCSYSYKCVEDIVAVLDSIITRLKRNPELCNPKKVNISPTQSASLDHPDKITLKWLYHNTSLKFWLWVSSAFAAVFILGVSFGQSTLYHDLTTKTENSTNLKTHVTMTTEHTDAKNAAPIKSAILKK